MRWSRTSPCCDVVPESVVSRGIEPRGRRTKGASHLEGGPFFHFQCDGDVSHPVALLCLKASCQGGVVSRGIEPRGRCTKGASHQGASHLEGIMSRDVACEVASYFCDSIFVHPW
ncbi:unnamed protein product [Ilex paraguariensis]|uniref:Uncharacterized protein n=1 Tax=Ilex paraguariensis TaxID=185542 RepID=A0ABC8RYV4_9AQUA